MDAAAWDNAWRAAAAAKEEGERAWGAAETLRTAAAEAAQIAVEAAAAAEVAAEFLKRAAAAANALFDRAVAAQAACAEAGALAKPATPAAASVSGAVPAAIACAQDWRPKSDCVAEPELAGALDSSSDNGLGCDALCRRCAADACSAGLAASPAAVGVACARVLEAFAETAAAGPAAGAAEVSAATALLAGDAKRLGKDDALASAAAPSEQHFVGPNDLFAAGERGCLAEDLAAPRRERRRSRSANKVHWCPKLDCAADSPAASLDSAASSSEAQSDGAATLPTAALGAAVVSRPARF